VKSIADHSKSHAFGRSQTMPIGDEYHGGVALAVAVGFGRLDELADFGRRQVLPLPVLDVWLAERRDCSVFAGWRHEFEVGFCSLFQPPAPATACRKRLLRAVVSGTELKPCHLY
jgi:hypothetical protein